MIGKEEAEWVAWRLVIGGAAWSLVRRVSGETGNEKALGGSFETLEEKVGGAVGSLMRRLEETKEVEWRG